MSSDTSQQDFYIKLEGIDGESKDSKHAKWVDALSWSYAVNQTSSMHSGGGGGTGKASFNDLSFVHYIDRASPTLMKYCASGKHIPKVTLSCCKSGDGSQEYMKVTLTDCIVTGIAPSGDPNDPRVMESVGLSYAKILVEVKEQNADGSMGATVEGQWDVKQNKE